MLYKKTPAAVAETTKPGNKIGRVLLEASAVEVLPENVLVPSRTEVQLGLEKSQNHLGKWPSLSYPHCVETIARGVGKSNQLVEWLSTESLLAQAECK